MLIFNADVGNDRFAVYLVDGAHAALHVEYRKGLPRAILLVYKDNLFPVYHRALEPAGNDRQLILDKLRPVSLLILNLKEDPENRRLAYIQRHVCKTRPSVTYGSDRTALRDRVLQECHASHE